MNPHLLLTGATGLLGRYLLRDLLLDGVRLAVLVRPSRGRSAEDRVEAVMQLWERTLQRPLPRPVVLSGDITRPGLGLDVPDSDWVRAECDSVLHNAASLTFHAAAKDDDEEPWRSNVRGVRNVLDFCAEMDIWDLHHVSTAYICGLRKGRVFETELDQGQRFSNDYERSKLVAEKMVREAGGFSSVTVYRPAIIVGDSQTGFTTTFHGFYHLVRLAWTLAQSPEIYAAASADNPHRVPTRITLSGNEAKNFVPVDWVSAAIGEIIVDRRLYGQTYHLTSANRVTARMMQDVIEDFIGVQNTTFCGAGAALENPTLVERLFYEHLQTYDSYWRDDPIFDLTNTRRALPDLPCPIVDAATLLRLVQKAVEMNFRFKDRPVRQLDWAAS